VLSFALKEGVPKTFGMTDFKVENKYKRGS